MSLPLITCVFQPKAVNLPSIGSIFRTSSAGAGLLEVIAIDDQGQVVEPELGGRRRRLPVLALVELAVTGQYVGMICLSCRSGRPGRGPRRSTAPGPSEPVEASTPASRFMLGWPSSGLPSLRSVMIWSCGK